MISLELVEAQRSELYQVAIFNEQPRNRKKPACLPHVDGEILP